MIELFIYIRGCFSRILLLRHLRFEGGGGRRPQCSRSNVQRREQKCVGDGGWAVNCWHGDTDSISSRTRSTSWVGQ